MAAEEARAMLDALMGGDRNAPLPPGAAMPRSKKKRKHDNGGGGGDMLLLPGKRSKSCFDPGIDPLYCAWGVDVYELFVNTKSDIGPNPYVVDEGARQEFLQLPPAEQERLGFYYFLFQKLQELVRSGDRTVARNKEKLAQELRRLAAKRGANPQQQQPVVDYVQDVDEQAVEALARNQLELEFLQKRLQEEFLVVLEDMQEQEDALKNELSALLDELREKDVAKKKEQESIAEENDGGAQDTEKNGEDVQEEQTKVKEEESTGGETAIEEEPSENGPQEVKIKEEESSETNVKQEENDVSIGDAPIQSEPNEEESGQATTTTTTPAEEKNPRIQELQTELGKLTLKKQRVLWETARTVSQVAPLQEAMDGQLRNLLYVKSDIAADKTVCEVSGNFMSARDADERIAAHYAGKQYVGWKLVREKFKEMIAKYGRYGPPPPDRANRGGGGPPPPVMGVHNQHHRGGRSGGPPPPRSNSGGNSGGGYGRGEGDRYGGGGGGGGGFDRGGGRGRGGGGWGDRGGGDRGRWERHGPGGPPGGRGFRR